MKHLVLVAVVIVAGAGLFFWNSQKLSDQGSNEEGPAQLGSPKSESIRNDNEWTDLDSFVEETESGSSLTDIKLETYAGTTCCLKQRCPPAPWLKTPDNSRSMSSSPTLYG